MGWKDQEFHQIHGLIWINIYQIFHGQGGDLGYVCSPHLDLGLLQSYLLISLAHLEPFLVFYSFCYALLFHFINRFHTLSKQ